MKKRKMHPNSLGNLTHEGRPLAFDEEKKRRYLSVTETGWAGVQEIAPTVQCSGISELLERMGRGELVISEASASLCDADELAESELAWQSYLQGEDPGVGADALKVELFGQTVE